ncbi:MAG: TIGR01777 family protein [Acidimicrobiia bacterium]|nr:TIGR01777 family protein [Acidimicrobiia bacterium]
MQIAITGATGLIGTSLGRALRAEGHEVVPIVRRPVADGERAVRWDPAAGTIDAAALEGIDAVVHLAGAGIGDHRWTEDYRREILDSRVRGTELLAGALAGLERRPSVLVSGSAIGFYGDTGDTAVDESAPAGDGFLADVCVGWEGATALAADAGIRVALLRTGIVLDRSGGALRKMLPLFRIGAGGRMGSGRQWWSWITIDDEVAAIRWLLAHEVSGPVNAVAPAPVTNKDFTVALARAMHRPAVFPVPAFGPRVLLGRELADALLFTSQRVLPTVLSASGFTFSHSTIDAALAAVLARSDAA